MCQEIEESPSSNYAMLSDRVCVLDPQVTTLNGEWKLVYTSNSELTALLALGKLPFVSVGDITQTIDGPSLTVINKARSGRPPSGPHPQYMRMSLSMHALKVTWLSGSLIEPWRAKMHRQIPYLACTFC